MLKKNFRVKKRKDFIKASRSGFYSRGCFVIAQCVFNGLDTWRVGFTASKKIGNAVVRNRCKRRMRSAASFVLKSVGLSGIDYILIAKNSVFYADWISLIEEVKCAVRVLNNRIRK